MLSCEEDRQFERRTSIDVKKSSKEVGVIRSSVSLVHVDIKASGSSGLAAAATATTAVSRSVRNPKFR